MQIEIGARRFPLTDAIRDYTVRRLQFSLSRFSGAMSRVRIRLDDLNGPKGGADKSVRITAKGPAIGALEIEETGSDLYSTIDSAAGRLARAARRSLERANDYRREARAIRAGKDLES